MGPRALVGKASPTRRLQLEPKECVALPNCRLTKNSNYKKPAGRSQRAKSKVGLGPASVEQELTHPVRRGAPQMLSLAAISTGGVSVPSALTDGRVIGHYGPTLLEKPRRWQWPLSPRSSDFLSTGHRSRRRRAPRAERRLSLKPTAPRSRGRSQAGDEAAHLPQRIPVVASARLVRRLQTLTVFGGYKRRGSDVCSNHFTRRVQPSCCRAID